MTTRAEHGGYYKRVAIEAVIFDFDGVLADTEALHFTAFRDVFAERGWPLSERDYLERYLGYDDRGLIVEYGRDHRLNISPDLADAILAEKSTAYRSRLSAMSVLYPGARECVARLSARFPLGIATGSLRDEVIDILTAAELLHAFRAIVAADDGAGSKPSPAPYLAVAQRIAIPANRCVAIEDSPGGLSAARAAGMRTIGITTTMPQASLMEADEIVERLDDIDVDLVRSLATRSSA